MSDERIILATESQPPPDLGAQASIRQTRKHQAQVAELVRRGGGEVLVHVGQGCVASLPSAEQALEVVTTLLARRSSDRGGPRRLRAALHRGPFGQAATPIADPTVAQARQLLELAGPSEVLASAALWNRLATTHLQTTPVAVWGAEGDGTPSAYRLLLNPLAVAESLERRPIPMWRIAGAVALSSVAVLTAIVVALLV